MTDMHEHVDFPLTREVSPPPLPPQRGSSSPATEGRSARATAADRAIGQPTSDRRLSDRRRGDRRIAQLVAGIDFEVDRRAGDRRQVHFVSAEELNERQRVRLDAIRFKALSDSWRAAAGSNASRA